MATWNMSAAAFMDTPSPLIIDTRNSKKGNELFVLIHFVTERESAAFS
jgi:hypothetical protein